MLLSEITDPDMNNNIWLPWPRLSCDALFNESLLYVQRQHWLCFFYV